MPNGAAPFSDDGLIDLAMGMVFVARGLRDMNDLIVQAETYRATRPTIRHLEASPTERPRPRKQ